MVHVFEPQPLGLKNRVQKRAGGPCEPLAIKTDSGIRLGDNPLSINSFLCPPSYFLKHGSGSTILVQRVLIMTHLALLVDVAMGHPHGSGVPGGFPANPLRRSGASNKSPATPVFYVAFWDPLWSL